MDQARMQKRNRRKKAALAVAAVLALALAGTFAWANYTQTALNEAKSSAQPGGRLHDDFTFKTAATSNKDIYVENFTDKDDGGVPIYARVRLLEYMETGPGAGTDRALGNNGSTSVALKGEKTDMGVNPTLSDKESWTLHRFGDAAGTDDEPIHRFWNWDYAGSTFYMPTYNKNKDSFEADINGSMADERLTATGMVNEPYCKYRAFASENVPDNRVDSDGLRNAYYDADDNIVDEGAATQDEGAGGLENQNYIAVREQHSSKKTLDSEVISMEEWKDAKGSQPGNYWVYDTDGWAYWAYPIEPGTATGLLLDNIVPNPIGEDWYYGIEAQAQFASYGEWQKTGTSGSEKYAFTKADPNNNGTVVTIDGMGNGMTSDAWTLLETVKTKDTSVSRDPAYKLVLSLGAGETANVKKEDSVTVTPKLKKVVDGVESDAAETPTSYAWTATPDGWATMSDADGVTNTVTITDVATVGGKVTVKVTATVTPEGGGASSTATGTIELTVEEKDPVPAGAEPFKGVEPGPAATVTLDTDGVGGVDTEFLYLAKKTKGEARVVSGGCEEEGNYGLVMLKTPTTNIQFNKTESNNPRWGESYAKEWCNGDYYNSVKGGLGSLIPKVKLTTSTDGTASSTVDTEDFAFYLSEADMFGKCGGSNVAAGSPLYTAGKQLLTANDQRALTTNQWYYLRSAYDANNAACVSTDGTLSYYRTDNSVPARPCFWVYLGTE